MIVPDGYTDVSPGKTASVVTWLQMFQRPPLRPERSDQPWALARVDNPDPSWYRSLFRRVGEDWLWFSRLQMTDDELRKVLHHAGNETYAFKSRENEEGLVELNFRQEGACELSYFGLTPPLIGNGAGRWLMNRVLEVVWSRPVTRFWVNTCSLDHPGALDFYIRTGFVPFRRQIEIAADPRAIGLLPKTAAPQIPLL